jgi:hypothetical protein
VFDEVLRLVAEPDAASNERRAISSS